MNALLVAFALLSAATDAPERPLRRFLLAISSEDGGPGKARLRYSASDARGVARVMQDLGGVSPGRTRFLAEPDSGRFLSEFRDLSAEMERSRDSGNRVELIAYYSGHSDEDALLLGRTRIPYPRLRAAIETAPAEMRLAVLDACASGAAVRTKGGVRREAFRIEGADRLRGQAFLTSSRAEEVSHESDRIGGSFFTQAFLAGIQGAADVDHDRKVTLLEAYRYAYDQTVATTSSTRSGPQHPEFDLDLSGSGDVVLTDLDQTGSVLGIDASVGGRITVSDSAGAIVADLVKQPGHPLDLGLQAGNYRIGVFGDSAARFAFVELPKRGRTDYSPSASDSLAKIVRDSTPVAIAGTAPDDSTLSLIPVNLGLFPPASINSLRPGRAWNVFSLDAFGGEAARIHGLQIAGFYAQAGKMDGMQIALAARTGKQRGIQIGGLGAWSDNGGTGLQMGLVDVAAGRVVGVQAGLVDVAAKDMVGAQLGVVAWTREHRGGQISVINIAGSVTGAQVGVLNVARSVKGAQVGVLNISGSSQGVQAGVVNVSGRARGAVVGVVNASKDLDALPIGLLSGGMNMRPGVEFSVDECGYGNLSFRLDGTRYHTRVGAVASLDEPQRRLGFAVGFGAHWAPASQWSLEGDVSQRQIWSLPGDNGPDDNANWNTVSVSVGRGFGPATVFAGISFNVLYAYDGDAESYASPVAYDAYHPGDDTRIWPGAFAGIRF